MDRNEIIISEDVWRRLPPELRVGLRRVPKRKASIIDHTVLDVTSALFKRGTYGLAFDLYQVLDGQLLIP
jgi:hypothetical protein